MKRFLMSIVACLMVACAALAQADKIVGNYSTDHNGVKSKIKIYKLDNGKYRAQVTWVSNLKMEDGSTRLDVRNPDKNKRNVPANQIVLVDGVSYDKSENVWTNGKIYDPTNGKEYKVTISFKDDKTLKIRGYIGVEALGKTVYWKKD